MAKIIIDTETTYLQGYTTNGRIYINHKPELCRKIFPLIIEFPEIDSNGSCLNWRVSRSESFPFYAPRYDIYSSDGTQVGFVNCNGRLWTNKKGSSIQIIDSNRNFDNKNRDELLQAVRLACLLTQEQK